MIKTCCLLCLICFTGVCLSQTNERYYGVVLTKIYQEDTGTDTTRYLYCSNIAGDRLSVYTVANGVVTDATAYHLTATKNGLFLYSIPMLSDQLLKDSLRIIFEDKANTVVINQRDRYQLFPDYYTRLKQQVKVRHSVMALFHLLTDDLGDYPITDALPLVNFKPDLDQQIYQARIVTQRSQSDIKDTWNCYYNYNEQHQLISVRASSTEETRFIKKVNYRWPKVTTISTYLNIEDRQVTDRTSRFDHNNRNAVKWKELVNEPGKNRETASTVTMTSHDLGQLRKIEPSTAEVLQLLKPIITHDFTKKHID